MEDVRLVEREEVDDLLHFLDAGGTADKIERESAPGESWGIDDRDRRDIDAFGGDRCGGDDLEYRHQAPEDALGSASAQGDTVAGDVERVGLDSGITVISPSTERHSDIRQPLARV